MVKVEFLLAFYSFFAFNKFSSIISTIEDIKYAAINTAIGIGSGIASVSREISKGIYNITIPSTYGENLQSLFKGYKGVIEIVESMNPGFFGKILGRVDEFFFGKPSESEKITPESVAVNIVALSNIISKGTYNPIPENWMQSVYQNMKQYLEIINLMSGKPMNSDIFGFGKSLGSGISRMASDFDKLANSIDGVSKAISGIEIEKVTALRALTGSVVLLSLMDADQFESMMDALEEKSAIIGDVFGKLEGGSSTIQPSVKTPSVAVNEGKDNIERIMDMMRQLDSRLVTIASASSNVSSYVNQLRSSPNTTSMKR